MTRRRTAVPYFLASLGTTVRSRRGDNRRFLVENAHNTHLLRQLLFSLMKTAVFLKNLIEFRTPFCLVFDCLWRNNRVVRLQARLEASTRYQLVRCVTRSQLVLEVSHRCTTYNFPRPAVSIAWESCISCEVPLI